MIDDNANKGRMILMDSLILTSPSCFVLCTVTRLDHARETTLALFLFRESHQASSPATTGRQSIGRNEDELALAGTMTKQKLW